MVNLEDDKIVISTIREQFMINYFRSFFDSDNFVCLHRFFGSRAEDVYASTISAITYKDGEVLKSETVSEPLDYDPSKGKNWEWEDYEQSTGA